jgi:hypothetical protein
MPTLSEAITPSGQQNTLSVRAAADAQRGALPSVQSLRLQALWKIGEYFRVSHNANHAASAAYLQPRSRSSPASDKAAGCSKSLLAPFAHWGSMMSGWRPFLLSGCHAWQHLHYLSRVALTDDAAHIFLGNLQLDGNIRTGETAAPGGSSTGSADVLDQLTISPTPRCRGQSTRQPCSFSEQRAFRLGIDILLAIAF